MAPAAQIQRSNSDLLLLLFVWPLSMGIKRDQHFLASLAILIEGKEFLVVFLRLLIKTQKVFREEAFNDCSRVFGIRQAMSQESA